MGHRSCVPPSSAGAGRRVIGRRLQREPKDRSTELEVVAVGELMFTDRSIVDERPIQRAPVANDVAVAGGSDLGVAARDRFLAQSDVGIGGSSEDHQRQPQAVSGPDVIAEHFLQERLVGHRCFAVYSRCAGRARLALR
jgi:hypothetical protein